MTHVASTAAATATGRRTRSTVEARDTCDSATRVTRSLLGYGLIAGPLYIAVSLAQALTRNGFDLSRHQWSLLANGSLGWIQVANFILAGLMVIAFAVGLRRALVTGPAATWAPRLVAVYGVSLLAAGVFRADPAAGFPAGTPEAVATVSWHGLLHFAAGGAGFACVAAACFVIARRYAAAGWRGYARFSRTTGLVFLAGFAMVASGGGSRAANLAFTAAIVLLWAWLAALARDLYQAPAAAPAPTGN